MASFGVGWICQPMSASNLQGQDMEGRALRSLRLLVLLCLAHCQRRRCEPRLGQLHKVRAALLIDEAWKQNYPALRTAADSSCSS